MSQDTTPCLLDSLGVRPTRLDEKYLQFYAFVLLLSGLLLMAIGVQEIEIYYTVYFIEFLVSVELLASFRRSLEKQIRPVVLAFALGFMYIVLQRILPLLR